MNTNEQCTSREYMNGTLNNDNISKRKKKRVRRGGKNNKVNVSQYFTFQFHFFSTLSTNIYIYKDLFLN